MAETSQFNLPLLSSSQAQKSVTVNATPSGTATEYEIVEIDHVLGAGTSSTTVPLIPQNAQVVGVTGRVIQEITGSLTSWKLGIDDDEPAPQRFGHGLGLALNSYVLGMSGTPTTYYSVIPSHNPNISKLRGCD